MQIRTAEKNKENKDMSKEEYPVQNSSHLGTLYRMYKFEICENLVKIRTIIIICFKH